MKNSKNLLREYVRETLSERTTGGGAAFGDYGSDLGDMFLKPFQDAGKVISGELQKLSARTQSAALKLISGTLSILMPWSDMELDRIVKHEEETIRAIENDPATKKAWETVSSDADTGVRKMAFLFNPVLYVATDLATKSPSTALVAAGALIGAPGAGALAAAAKKLYQTNKDSKLNTKKKRNDWKGMVQQLNALRESRVLVESVSSESVEFFLNSPEVQNILKNSQGAKRIISKSDDMSSKTANKFDKAMSDIESVETLEQLTNLTGKTINLSVPSDIDQAEQASMESSALENIKNELKKSLVTGVLNHIKETGLADSPEHPYVKLIMSKVESVDLD